MATTLASFYTTLSDMSVTGVVTLYDEPPLGAIPTAQLPGLWVDIVGIDEAGLRAKGAGGERTLRGRVVVVISGYGQDLQSNRWSDARTMVDSLNTALKTAFTGNPNATWQIDINPNLDDSGYLAVTASVQQSEWTVN